MTDPILQRWREDAEKFEEEKAKARRERVRKENRRVEGYRAEQLGAEFAARLAALEQGYIDLQSALVESMRAINDTFHHLADQPSEHSEIAELKVKVAKLATTIADIRSSSMEFRFARERDGATPPVKLDS
jgi:hypothetical protein